MKRVYSVNNRDAIRHSVRWRCNRCSLIPSRHSFRTLKSLLLSYSGHLSKLRSSFCYARLDSSRQTRQHLHGSSSSVLARSTRPYPVRPLFREVEVGICEASQFQVEVGGSMGPVEDEYVCRTSRGRRGPEKGRESYRGGWETSGALAASYGFVSASFTFLSSADAAKYGSAYRRQAQLQVC